LTKLKNIPASLLGSSVTVRYALKGVLPEIEIKNIPANLLGSSVTVRYALKRVLPEIELKNKQ
jgi:hypothetical protein